jgi:hypothetical protein
MLAVWGIKRHPLRRPQLFFFELSDRARGLLHDVYRLARAFHWAERDILSLALERRLAYMLLLEEEADASMLADLFPGDRP